MERPSAAQFAVEAARIASDLNCDDVIALDLRGISPVTDFVVIGTGTSDRQMNAVADELIIEGKKVGEKPYGVSGYNGGTWVLVDFVDVVVHIFSRTYRDYYDLELLWGDAPRLDWSRNESS